MRSILAGCLFLFVVMPSVVLGQQVAPKSLPDDSFGGWCSRPDRYSLSSAAYDALYSIEADGAAIANSPVPPSLILSTCNRFISVQVDGPAIFSAARDFIALADHEVNIAFYKWEAASQGARLIGDGLIAAQVRRTPDDPLLVRIVVDDVEDLTGPSRDINNLYDSQKDWINRGLDLSRVHLQLGTSPRPTQAAAAMHDKIIVVDSRYVLVTGAQPQPANDPLSSQDPSGWHDTGYLFEGDAAISALAAFEQTWTGDAVHWDCRPQSLSFDCDKRANHFPQPSRDWAPSFGSQSPGDIPLLAVGRTKAGNPFNNDTNNPQDIAWLRVMDYATSSLHIETPNINDDAFQAAVKRAVARGVSVRLVTSLGFNDFRQDLPSLGGDNLEVAGRLRQQIRNETPWYQDLFQLKWYSRDGIEPLMGNGIGANHTKYMTMDNQMAVVGSGNMDTASWNIIHEFNLLIDDPSTTWELENNVFLPDWYRSVGSYLELYEGNSGTQDVVCPIGAIGNKSLRFRDLWQGSDARCDNDEARSVLLHDVPAGKVFRFYDDGDRAYQDDDWTEIIVKQPVSRKYVDTFERSYEDSDVRVIFHRDNGLDGKISAAEVDTAPVGAVVDLYEGNSGSQSLVCSNRVTQPRTINLTQDAYCNNDEARSLVLYDFPMDKVIFVYDESGGSTSDDWTIIVPKRAIKQTTVGTFESSYENADVRVCSFYDNGLDGKVSRVRIASRSEAIGICGVTADPVSGGSAGNPFTYASGRDEFLACYGIAGRISSNCRDISDYNDKQMCYALSDSTQAPCASMTDRNMQLACYGMSINYPSNCRDITDSDMRNVCYAESYQDIGYCGNVTNRNTQLLCYALSNGISSNCDDITNANDRQFCYGVSTHNNSYCAAIQQ